MIPAVASIVSVYLTISSCVASLPKAEDKARIDEIRQLDCNYPYSKAEIDLAKELFYTVWLERFGDPDLVVGINLDRLCVEFEPEKWHVKSGYYESGKPIPPGGSLVLGQAYSRSHVRVYSPNNEIRLHKTALVHELVHASLMALLGHGDADHLGDKYEGWTKEHSKLIHEVNDLLGLLDF